MAQRVFISFPFARGIRFGTSIVLDHDRPRLPPAPNPYPASHRRFVYAIAIGLPAALALIGVLVGR